MNSENRETLSVFGQPELKSTVQDRSIALKQFLNLMLSILMPAALGWGCSHVVSSILGLTIHQLEFLLSMVLFSVILYLMLRSPKGLVAMILYGIVFLGLSIVFRSMIRKEAIALFESVQGLPERSYTDATHLLMLFGYLHIFFGMAVPVRRMHPAFLAFVPVLPMIIFITIKQGPTLLSTAVTLFSLMALFFSGRALRTMEAMDENAPYQAKVALPLFILAMVLSLFLTAFSRYVIYEPNRASFEKAAEAVDEDFLEKLLAKLPGDPFRTDDKGTEKEETQETGQSPETSEAEPSSREEAESASSVSDETQSASQDISYTGVNPADDSNGDGSRSAIDESTEEEEEPSTKLKGWITALILTLFAVLLAGGLWWYRKYFIRPLKTLTKENSRETYLAVYREIRKRARASDVRFTVDDSPEKLMELYPTVDRKLLQKLQLSAKEASYSPHEFTEEDVHWIYDLYRSRKLNPREPAQKAG
ncbi:MAG: hypothetical protein IJL98_08895 [Lachnospiraceae bacterium]|nr:hypothetical protein [Lachnospiraceae bacterium]